MDKNDAQKIVLFDFDGVLVQTFEMCYQINLNEYPHMTLEEYRDLFNGNVYAELSKYDKKVGHTREFDFFGTYSPLLMKHQPVAGIASILHALAGKHPLIIVSSTLNSPIQDYLSQHDLSKYFAEILGSDFETSKVKKIQNVITRYGVASQNAVFVTDTLGDIREAQKVGVGSIGVTWGFHQRERLIKGNPAAVVEHPNNLLAAIEAYLDSHAHEEKY